ncbi:MAG: hypothetical protein QF386_05105 [Alphaproteobacteria bacterium]|nr:hypothetical protein [Alphaproteobacteria bacterium]MDP6781711.1 hypothetical protein [Alphaproteobacteria bacterium]MDP7044986.1 hypothetical protein [Alphaproteobacteria bacterium]
MFLNNPLKMYIYAYGLRAGLSFQFLKGWVDFLDALKRPLDWRRRRGMANSVTAGSKWRGFFTKEKGMAAFAPGEIPGLENVHLLGQRIYKERKDEVLKSSRGKNEYNPFHVLLTDEEVSAYPELVEAALSEPLMEMLTDYFGAVPRLQNVNMWIATPDEANIGSNLFHLDKPDVHFVTVFINVFPVALENGPVTALPADLSHQACLETHYESLYYNGDGRLPDVNMLNHCGEENLFRLIGPAGAGAICDTSTCLHYGSRCREGERVSIVFRYAPAHKIKGKGTAVLPHPQKMDSTREMFLGA